MHLGGTTSWLIFLHPCLKETAKSFTVSYKPIGAGSRASMLFRSEFNAGLFKWDQFNTLFITWADYLLQNSGKTFSSRVSIRPCVVQQIVKRQCQDRSDQDRRLCEGRKNRDIWLSAEFSRIVLLSSEPMQHSTELLGSLCYISDGWVHRKTTAQLHFDYFSSVATYFHN